jgi:predicted O-methyltransferase YrrM
MELSLNEKETVRDAIENIEGFLTVAEGALLYDVAKHCDDKHGAIVEIGSWKGKSTVCLGRGSQAGQYAPVYTVDPHQNTSTHKVFATTHTYEEFKRNIQEAGVSEVIFPIIKTSQEAAELFLEPVHFLFIDGEHDYEMVRLDFQLWYPKVIYGGFIAFHDFFFSGPKKVLERQILKSKHFKAVRIVDSLFLAQKVKRNCVRDRITNIFLFLLFKCTDLYYSIPFSKPRTKLLDKILKLIKIKKK